MSWRSAVVWSQGMFLQPHHFQQEARYNARLVEARVRCLSTHAWGLTALVLDDSLLPLGMVGVTRAVGVLPDGTPFAIPHLDAPPTALEVATDMRAELIYLTLPLSREGVSEVDFGDGSGRDAYRVEAVEERVRDSTSATDEPASIQTARPKLRLMRARDLTDAHAVIGVAQVSERRSDSQVVLDRSYIPPEVVLDATDTLVGSVKLLHGLILQRAQALAERMGQLSSGVSELADFLMLQLLNRAEPLFRQYANSPALHPFALFVEYLALAGELSTVATPQRRPPVFPPYCHEDLRGCFAPLTAALRDMLSVVLEKNAISIELIKRSHGVRTAVVPDLELVRNGIFVLAAKAQVPPEQVRQNFVAQTKIGTNDRIRTLVDLALPGIALQALQVVPRQLPYHAGFSYFELERGTELWLQFEKTGSLVVHTAGEFPGLELELWAIRQ